LASTAPPQHRRVIVVISDGEDNYSERIKAEIGETAEELRAATPAQMQGLRDRIQAEVQREIQRADAVFYSINPSGQALFLNVISTRAQNNMARLAAATGGDAFIPEKVEDFDRVFRQIAAELRAQYLLQYYSNNDAPNGKYLRIQVTAPTHANLRVRARQGYYAKR
jgi:Ca-activated chloride channel family protein